MGLIINPYRYASNLSADLLAWWPLNETSGIRYDAHTGNYHLTSINNVGYGTGKQNNAADFEVSSADRLERSSSDSAFNPSGDITVCAWVKLESNANFHFWVAKYGGTGDQRGWALWTEASGSGGQAKFSASNDGAVTGLSHAIWGSALSTGTWYFLAGGYDSANNEVWVSVDNGTPVTAAFTGPIHASTFPLKFGDIFTDGLLDETGIWSRKLSSSELTQLYAAGSGVSYYDVISRSNHWAYSSLSVAEASGDSWQDGDEVVIIGGARFVYYSALESNGHSGLIHEYPFNDLNAVSAVNLITAEGPNTDPDSWGAEWNDSGTGTKGVDYDHDTGTGPTTGVTNSRLRALTSSGRVLYEHNTPAPNSAWISTFTIVRNAEWNVISGTGGYGIVTNMAYKDASNRNRTILDANTSINSGFWQANSTTLSVDPRVLHDIWLYVDGTRASAWFDADPSAAFTGSPVNSTAGHSGYINSGNTGTVVDATLSSHLYGQVTAT